MTPPVEPTGLHHVYHQYTIRTEERDALADNDVETGIYYPTPIHERPAFPDVDCSAPAAERVADEVLSLPVHPGVDGGDVDHAE